MVLWSRSIRLELMELRSNDQSSLFTIRYITSFTWTTNNYTQYHTAPRIVTITRAYAPLIKIPATGSRSVLVMGRPRMQENSILGNYGYRQVNGTNQQHGLSCIVSHAYLLPGTRSVLTIQKSGRTILGAYGKTSRRIPSRHVAW